MIRALLFLTLFSVFLFGFELRLNSGIQDKQSYSIIHIENDEPFACEIRKNKMYEDYIVCSYDKIPSVKLEDKNTTFFDIAFDVKKEEFDLVLTPKFYFILTPNHLELKDEHELLPSKDSKFNHWTLLGYRQNAPFLSQKRFDAINFPVTFPDVMRPYVGALDFNGKPIVYSKSNDLNAYIDIKKEFLRKGYDKVLKLIDSAMRRYKNSIFTKEFILYKLKTLDRLYDLDIQDEEILQGNDIVDIALKWVKSFPSDDNLPEVLLILSKAYLKLGYRNDANYYFDVLITEHPDNKYARLGILHFADTLYNSKQKNKAIGLYRDVYYSAKDLDVASQAAVRLAKAQIDKGNLKEAKEYYDKILALNSDFVLDDLEDAVKLANDMANKELFELSANIGEKVLDKSTKTSIYHEDLLKDVALWYDKAGVNEKAYEFYKKYQNLYRFGIYSDIVKNNLDRLFFKLKDANTTEQLEHYEYVLNTYDEQEIYNRAVEEKAKILFAQQKYSEADIMRDKLKDVNVSEYQVFADTTKELIKSYLTQDNCIEASRLYIEREVSMERKYDTPLFECLMRLSSYPKAKEIFERNIQSEDIKQKANWMAKGVKLLAKSDNGKDALLLYGDLQKIADKANFDASNLLYDIFALHEQKNDIENMINIANQIKEKFPTAYKNVPLYLTIATSLQKQNSESAAIGFFEDAYNLQKSAQKYTFSPTLELDYIEVLKKLDKNSEALRIAKELASRKFSPDLQSRILYIAGDLSIKQDEKSLAKEYFDKCVALEVQSSWKSLCQSGLGLLK
jgi:tetratricopeptide (TPR) repeat protein